MARSRLTIREARKLGLTIRNIAPILVELKKQEGFEDKTASELAFDVLGFLVSANPEAFNTPGIDWDAIIEFIEKLIPLILKLIEIFSLLF